jgi:hypothetical protein
MFFLPILLISMTATALPLPQTQPTKPLLPADWGMDLDDINIITGGNPGAQTVGQNCTSHLIPSIPPSQLDSTLTPYPTRLR